MCLASSLPPMCYIFSSLPFKTQQNICHREKICHLDRLNRVHETTLSQIGDLLVVVQLAVVLVEPRRVFAVHLLGSNLVLVDKRCFTNNNGVAMLGIDEECAPMGV